MNSNKDISEWHDLWSSPGKYCLVQHDDSDIGLIIEIDTMCAVIIEDAEAYAAVIERMKRAGVPIFSELPD